MTTNTLNYGLLKRNPALTPEEFSDHWFTKHAPLVVPFFLHAGIRHYEQIPSSLTTSDPTLEISARNRGLAGIVRPETSLDATPRPKWKDDYYREVILADERRFLISEALQHVKRVGPGTVKGEKRMIIENRKCVIPAADAIGEFVKSMRREGRMKITDGENG